VDCEIGGCMYVKVDVCEWLLGLLGVLCGGWEKSWVMKVMAFASNWGTFVEVLMIIFG